MAGQTTPHTGSAQNADSAQADLEPNMNPQDSYRADTELYENSEGAQTGGTRAFNANADRDNQPKSIDEGTGATQPRASTPPQGNVQGVTSHSVSEEHARQEKLPER